MEQVTIQLNPDGTLKIDTSGYKGEGCLRALDTILKELEQAGIKTSIETQKKKPEAYVRTGSSLYNKA